MQDNLYLDSPDGHAIITLEYLLSALIIGITIGILIPGYSNYIRRAQVSELFMLFWGGRTESVEYYAEHGQWPNELAWTQEETGTHKTGNFRYEDGAISGDLKSTRRSLTVRPMMLNSQASVVVWSCGYAPPLPGFIVYGPNRTNMPPLHLPHICRY